MLNDLSWLKRVKILNAIGELLNPATDEKLEELKTNLDDVKTKLDNLQTELNQKTEPTNNQNIDIKIDSVGLAKETTLQSTNTKIGEVQTSPTQYTILGRLKDLWDKLNDLFTNGTGKIKLWNGTTVAETDAQGNILVAGKSPTGSAPSSNPVYVSGIDISGNKRGVLTDSVGRLQINQSISASALNIPVQLGMTQDFSAVNNYEWQEILEYIVPNGYDFNCVMFDAYSATANEKARALFKADFGSFVGATNTFTDGESWTLPRFSAKLYVYVTSLIGSGGNDIITITYTNNNGITGHTATVTITKNSLAGTRLEVPLQTGDFGLIDVTNVTHSQVGQIGNINIEGILGLFFLVLSSSNVGYTTPCPPLGGIVVPQGGKVYLQFQANTAGVSTRRLNLTGTLVPR